MNTFRAGLFVGIAGALIVAALVMAIRLAETWSPHHTDLLLGGVLAIAGGMGIALAVFVGAGAFARLAGWRPPRQDGPPPPLETAWRDLTPPSQALPPWGVTGGGNFELLPPAEQDRRYRFDLREVKKRDGA